MGYHQIHQLRQVFVETNSDYHDLLQQETGRPGGSRKLNLDQTTVDGQQLNGGQPDYQQ